MTQKDCGHGDGGRGDLGRRIAGGILFLIFIILLIIFLVWLILRPSKPHFILQDATVYALNVTQPSLLTVTLQITLSSRNPNERIGVYYERLDVYASYHNQQVTYATRIPTTYQGHKEGTVWSPFLYGNNVPVAPYLALSLLQDQNAGIVQMNIKVDGRVKWKVGTWISGKYRIWVNCPAYLPFGSRSSGISIGSGAAIKYQLASSCHAEVSI